MPHPQGNHSSYPLRALGLAFALAAYCLLALGALGGCGAAPDDGGASRPSAETDVEAMAGLNPIDEQAVEPEPPVGPPAPPPDSNANAPDAAKRAQAAHDEALAIEQRIAEGDASAKICYLTLDDGPSENTRDILSILQEKGVLATWFIQGNSAQIDLVKDIADAGHGIGLHTYSHDYAQVYANDDAYFADLAAVQEAVSSRIGHTVDIVRFPGGTSNAVSANYNAGIMSRLAQSVPAAGFQYFDWNFSGGDSSSPPPPAEAIAANVLDNVGSMQRVCVLAHDTAVKRTTVEALPAIIDGLRGQGYAFGVLERDTPPFQHQPGN